MLNGPLLDILEQTGTGVLILTEGLEEAEFFATRLTRQEVLERMQTMATTATHVPSEVKVQLAEIDWAGWSALAAQFSAPGDSERDALWFGVRSLVPATLMWLRVYRSNQPELFSYAP